MPGLRPARRAVAAIFGAAAAVLAGAALLLARSSLDTADRYASVGSLFVGILGLTVAVVGLLRGPGPDRAQRPTYELRDNTGVVIEPQQGVKMKIVHDDSRSRRRRR